MYQYKNILIYSRHRDKNTDNDLCKTYLYRLVLDKSISKVLFVFEELWKLQLLKVSMGIDNHLSSEYMMGL